MFMGFTNETLNGIGDDMKKLISDPKENYDV